MNKAFFFDEKIKSCKKYIISNHKKIAHALPRIFKKEVLLPIKIFWLLVMLLCWAWAFYFIIIALIKFFAYPTNSNVDNLTERPTNFPAIDICNFLNIAFLKNIC